MKYQFKFLAAIFFIVISSQAIAAQCEISVRDEWGTGYTATVVISNDTDSDISGWQVDLAFEDGSTINNMWNATVGGSAPNYTGTNKGYNAQISPNNNRSFGFNVRKGQANEPAMLPSLGGICVASAPPHLKIHLKKTRCLFCVNTM